MKKRTLLTLGLSAMLAMPILAVGQQTSTPGTSGGMGAGESSSGARMEQRGQQEVSQEQIREIQQQLKEAGFYKGSIDGQLGPQTAEAIREYQKSHGLPQTGRLDEPTRQLLMTAQSPGGSTSGSTTHGGRSSGGSSLSGSGMGSSGAGSTGSGSSGLSGSGTGGTSGGTAGGTGSEGSGMGGSGTGGAGTGGAGTGGSGTGSSGSSR